MTNTTIPLDSHRIRWYARLDGDWIPRNQHMLGGLWGWDVKCSCGWQTRTGGAIQERIRDEVALHKFEVGGR